MIKVKLDKVNILDNLQSEDDLFDSSTIEAIYEIRTLKALLNFGEDIIEVESINDHGQAYVKDFDIWMYVLVQE
jgi:hypothetical protein